MRGAVLQQVSFQVLTSVLIGLTLVTAEAAEEIYYYHNDHLGTPQYLTDANQNVVWKAGRAPFGSDEPVVAAVDNILRFPGQYYDQETDLHYNWNRYYDPGTGRYITSDPIGLDGGVNTYTYAGANPLLRIDILGLAYFAKRPLSNLPWLGPLSCNSLDDRFNTEISHEQLFFEDGKSPANIGFGPDGLFTETIPAGYRRQDGGYDDCIMRIAYKRVPTGSYRLIGNNCQDWAQRVRDEYNRTKNTSIVDECNTCTL